MHFGSQPRFAGRGFAAVEPRHESPTRPRFARPSRHATRGGVRPSGHVAFILSPLEGAVVQKVRLGVDRLSVDLRAPGRSTWVELQATASGLRLRGGEGKSEAIEPCPDATLVRYARKHLEGARFAAVGPAHVDFLTPAGLVRLSTQGKAGRFIPRFSDCPLAEGTLPSEAELFEAQPVARGTDDGDPLARARQELRKAIEREKKRTEKTLAAVQGDAAAIERARSDASKARFLIVAAKAAPPGTTELVADVGGGESVHLSIDPRVAPQVALDRVFARSKRLAAREEFVRARAAALEASLEAFSALLADLVGGSTALLDIEDLRASFRTLARSTSTTVAARGREGAAARLPHKTFVGAGGREIFVGRSSAKNHELTFRVAKSWDLWLHAREVEGAHVVVRLRKGEDPTPELLLDAAHLAAHFSKARDERIVDVQYTSIGHLKKLPAPGAVVVTRERVIATRIEPGRTAALLVTER